MVPSSFEPLEVMFHAVHRKRMSQSELLSIQRISDRLRSNPILGTHLAQPQDSSIKLQVMVRAQNEHIAGFIWSMVWFPKPPDVCCFRIELISPNFQLDSTELAGILVVPLQRGSLPPITLLLFLFNRVSLYYSVRLLLIQPFQARLLGDLWHKPRRRMHNGGRSLRSFHKAIQSTNTSIKFGQALLLARTRSPETHQATCKVHRSRSTTEETVSFPVPPSRMYLSQAKNSAEDTHWSASALITDRGDGQNLHNSKMWR